MSGKLGGPDDGKQYTLLCQLDEEWAPLPCFACIVCYGVPTSVYIGIVSAGSLSSWVDPLEPDELSIRVGWKLRRWVLLLWLLTAS